ncbi:MAG: hypothetical protein GY772_14295 [bacterium]|nr:hypothetical protein [bacterium]
MALSSATESDLAQAAAKHHGPFLYAAWREGRPFASLVLRWSDAPRRCAASGFTGSAELLEALPEAVLGLRKGSTFRVHVCCRDPCTAIHHPSKYGAQEPPLFHGRVTRLIAGDEDVEALHLELYVSTVLESGRDASAGSPGPAAGEDVPAARGISAVAEVPPDAAAAPRHEPVLTAAAMATWAGKVARLGEYVGFFTFLVFAVLRQRKFFVRIGPARIDVVETFAPWALEEGTWGEHCCVDAVACRLDVERGCDAVSDVVPATAVNHYVAAVSLSLGEDPASETPAVAGGEGLDATYRRLGVGILRTVADGDCGLDVLTLADGDMRGVLQRSRLRRELQAFTLSVAADVRWQHAFLACQEVPEAELAEPAPPSPPPPLPPPVSPPPAPPPDSDLPQPRLRREAGDSGDDAAPPTDAASGADAHHSRRGDDDSELVAAMRWATGLPAPTPHTVRRLLEALGAEDSEHLKRAFAARGEPRTPGPRRAHHLPPRRHTSTYQWQRARDARLFLAFAAAQGQGGRGPGDRGVVRKFLESVSDVVLPASEVKRVGQYLQRACALQDAGGYLAASRHDTRGGGAKLPKTSSRRFRARGMQGRPRKAPLVRELLYDWFTSLRRSVTCRIPRKALENKAKAIVDDYIVKHARRGQRADAPVINAAWVGQWMLQYRVSLRCPNRKWKVPRAILLQRLETFWGNVARVRALFLLAHGHEPVFENFDQSPFHMNEAGSKGTATLAVRGAFAVPLKEGHAATRERWSVNTMTTSCERRAKAIPPLQLMFKGSGPRLAQKLSASIPAWAPWLSVVTGPRGSYREEHILNYLEAVLEPHGPERPWRVLLCDAYAAQTTAAVRRAAWQRGYVVITHGGGQTPVTQTNDTDLHARLKHSYLELEADEMIAQQRLRPSACPVPRKHDVIQWQAILWSQASMHTPAVAGYKKNGITNALDGSEDHLICRDAGDLWKAIGMSRRRDEVVTDVRCEWAARRLQWCYEDVYRLVVPFPDAPARFACDVDDAGSDEAVGEEAWRDEATEDEDLVEDGGQDAEPRAAEETSAVAEGPSGGKPLSAEQADAAEEHSRRLRILRSVLKDVGEVDGGSLRVTILNAIHAEERRGRGRQQTDPQVAAAVAAEQDAEERRELLEQKSLQERLAAERKGRSSLAELVAEQRRVAVARRELAAARTIAACDKAVKSFETSDLGQGHIRGGGAFHVATRMDVMDRVMRKGSPLPPELMNDWSWFKRKWDITRLACIREKASWGSVFRDIMRALLQEIADGRTDAVAAWMRRETRRYLAAPALQI